MLMKDCIVGRRDTLEGPICGDWENEGIVETTRSLEDRTATGTATQYRDGVLLAKFEVYFGGDMIGITYDNEVTGWFPKTQDAFFAARLT
jgi:hypothetical protein